VSRLFATLASIVCFSTICPASSSVVEVLYVAGPHGRQPASLLAYNMNPKTAVAQEVGQPVKIEASSIDPLTVGGMHLIYVWNATDVWMYVTSANGVPESKPSQHLKFTFRHRVNTFLADPNGKFAYAALTWTDVNSYYHAVVVLFTIDQRTGKLTNTGRVVARYQPNQWIALTGFMFGGSGRNLYASYDDYGPYTCGFGYDYYVVNQTTGHLGSLIRLTGADCGGVSSATAVTDLLTATASACCGQGSGWLDVTRRSTGQTIDCSSEMLAFCGDDVSALSIDPASRNVFFADFDVKQLLIGHIDFNTLQLVATSSSIPGLPPVYFNPDSKVVYAVNSNYIGIYAFDSASGNSTASTSLPDSGNVTIATATLKH
jgi:hypothetical protein